MTLGPVRQAPDDLMQLPVADLLAKAARRVERMGRFVDMLNRQRMPADADWRRDLLEEAAQREVTLCRIAGIAIRARAQEVCRFCDSVGLMNCTPALVRGKPLEVALAVKMHFCRRNTHGC